MVKSLRIYRLTQFNIVEHIETEIYIRRIVDTALQLTMRNTGTLSQQFATAIAAIRINRHSIGSIKAERSTIGHTFYTDTLAYRLGHIHLIENTGG